MRCHDQRRHQDRVELTLHFDRDELTLTETPFGTVVALAGLKSGGEPGTPALPRTQVRIAVPTPFWPDELHLDDEHWETVVEADALVTAAQPLRPGAAAAPENCCDTRTFRPPIAEGFAPPTPVIPDADAYARAADNPPPAARAVRIETIGTARLAVVELNPVRLTSRGGLELCTRLTVSVRYTATAPLGDKQAAVEALRERLGHDVDPARVIAQPEPVITDAAEAARLHTLARSTVLNEQVLTQVGPRWPELDLPCQYLIVTDDRRWNPATITPGAAVPGMVDAFGRLAAAKRARGISARVVTITDIVGGRWGDFRTGSRDLQEVIRKFLKHARQRWGVAWLLLGGDVSVVPVRTVAGAMLGHVPLGTNSTPDDNTAYWTGTQLRMNIVNIGDWWSASTDNLLVNAATGAFIPYDSTGSSSSTSAGWYFATSDWKTRVKMPSQYVVVNGPASIVNAELMFLYTWNQLPTDFYYASLQNWVVGLRTLDLGWFKFQVPYVYEPEHDWDAVGNGIYGQHRSDGTDLDGVHLQTDLSVGRAPVESAAQASTFVDKVLTYERAGGRYSFTLDRDWPTRMVIASSDWGGPTWFTPTVDSPPANGQFHAADGYTLLKTDTAPAGFGYELIAQVSDSDRRILPYKASSDASVRGWYYARSATDLGVNQASIVLPWKTLTIPLTSQWIVVHGQDSDRNPTAFLLDSNQQDGSMADQETLRHQIRTDLPAIDEFERLYEDELDLPWWERLQAPVEYLTSAGLQAALNARPHFVSLSGHGNSDGCCDGSVWLAGSLTNGLRGFIGYADSCLTNQFDADDAFSEALVNNPNGGAVAYVGNTRFSWIGVGDDFQRAFFHRLTTTRHLGLLNDSRIAVFGTTGAWQGYERWAIFTLNLLGDPELQVYRAALPGIRVVFEPVGRTIRLTPIPLPRPVRGPVPDPAPLRNALVRLRSGDRTADLRADADGTVRLPADLAADIALEVTVSHPEYVTAQTAIEPADTGCHDRAEIAAVR